MNLLLCDIDLETGWSERDRIVNKYMRIDLKKSTHGEHHAVEYDVLPGDATKTNGAHAVSKIYVSVPYGLSYQVGH